MIKAPWYRDDTYEFNLYAMECEGLIPTHDGKINLLINRLAKEENPNNLWIQREICKEIDLNLDDLSDKEIEYIEKETARRRFM